MIDTKINQLLGTTYPIIQGGMAWVADAKLAAAVSNGGGLGLIAAMNMNGEMLKAEIAKAKALTDKPFGVNIMIMSPYAEEVAKAVIEAGVKIVTTGAGNPARFMPAWINAGIKVIPVVPSVALAKLAERNGAAAVVAEGGESGGHVGDLTTMTLVPLICDAVSIPVIAAGGIGDGRGIAAAFMLGAQGVQIGTRFLVAYECDIHQNYKDRVIKAKDTDTFVTGRRLGHPVRCLKSPFTREMSLKEYDSTITNEQLEALAAGSLRVAVQEGDASRGSFMCGQIAALVKKEQSAKEIIEEMFSQAEELLKAGTQWVK